MRSVELSFAMTAHFGSDVCNDWRARKEFSSPRSQYFRMSAVRTTKLWSLYEEPRHSMPKNACSMRIPFQKSGGVIPSRVLLSRVRMSLCSQVLMDPDRRSPSSSWNDCIKLTGQTTSCGISEIDGP